MSQSSTTRPPGRRIGVVALLLSVAAMLAVLVAPTTASGQQRPFPDVIPLPGDFGPEGIVVGRGTTVYAGSVIDGSIWRGDLRTGEGEVIVNPDDGRSALGLSHDKRNNLVWAAGGFDGMAYVYDGNTGAERYAISLTATPGLVNDLIITERAAYFTDSFRPVLYRVPLGRQGRPNGPATEIPLGGDFNNVPGEINSNGIAVTPDGRHLIVVNLFEGLLYRVDPRSGEADLIDLRGQTFPGADGLILRGRVLHIVQNAANQVVKINLNARYDRGQVQRITTDDEFRFPTTGDILGRSVYVVNARFNEYLPPQFGGAVPDPDFGFEIVRIPR